MSGEHARVMRLFGTMATAPNEGCGFKGQKEPWSGGTVADVARQCGWSEDKEAQTDHKMLDLANSQHRVRREKLVAELQSKNRPSEGSGVRRSSD